MIDSYANEKEQKIHRSSKNSESFKVKNIDSVKSAKSVSVNANYRYRKSNIEKFS